MAISVQPAGRYAMVEATLTGFTSEQLAFELAKRHGKEAPVVIAKGLEAYEAYAVNAQIAKKLDQHYPSGDAVLSAEFHIWEFDTQAMLDQIEAHPNFKGLLKSNLGLTVLDGDDRDQIGQAIASGGFRALYEALLARVDPSTRYIWSARRGERPVAGPALTFTTQQEDS